jgi:hypothetical protein
MSAAGGTWPTRAIMTCIEAREWVTSREDATDKAVAHHWQMHPRRMRAARMKLGVMQ